MSVDVGPGWRLLEVGEVIEAGDEFFFRSGWFPVSPKTDAAVLDGLASRFSVRRRVPAATADAPTQTPEEYARAVESPEWRRLQKIVTSLLDRVEALESSANLASREIRRLKSRVSELE